jgi:type VI secretion system protein ImpJ
MTGANMSKPSKVLWGQGQYLAPQHFQQQDRYHEACLHQISSTLQPYLWGVRGVTWDREALKVNKLRLLALSAIFPTGDIVDAPDNDPLPAAIDLGALPSDVQDITYYAAMPGWTGGSNVAQRGGSGARTRYSQTEQATADQLVDGDPKPVRYLKKNVILISSLTPLGDYDCFPIIKLRRAVSGGFEQEASFIPPSLSVGSAPALLGRLTQLLEALQAKAEALQGNLREPRPNVIEFRSADVAPIWLLTTVNTHATVLTHYLHNTAMHPERLFEAM